MPDLNPFNLQESLERLRAAGPQGASLEVEMNLRHALMERRRRRQRNTWYLAAAALLLLSLGWLGWSRRAANAPAVSPESSPLSTFIALPYGQSDVPLENAVIVRVEVQSATGPVAADLLVGQDGMARAVRLAQ
jgi:hypothetical protein